MNERPGRTVELLTPSTRAVLGECPVWDERTATLYWVDIERGLLHQSKADGSALRHHAIGQRIGCVVLRAHQPGFIAGLEHSVAVLALDPLEIRTLATVDAQLPGNRCNDGKCDGRGRFWVGTCDQANQETTGWFYRLESKEARLERVWGPFICTNGPAFSTDGKIIYCVDSYGRTVYAHTLSSAGELSERRIFARFDTPDAGYPDGLTCDLEGCVWIAEWGASRLTRFSPAGERLEMLHLPVTQPTSCTFGGPDLRRLFITSASLGLDAQANANGLAGAVFAVDLPVGGTPAARYDG
jgi:sugar lactone lactonase YvrE